MSFGVYRPVMGVPGGHRETSANRSLQEQRRQGERHQRLENPITGEPVNAPGAAMPPRPPSESFGTGLVPTKGPMDHMTIAGKDVPAKRLDPTKNLSSAHRETSMGRRPSQDGPRNVSRITEGSIGELLSDRAPTPESQRRSTPGQVVRGGVRPKDQLLPGLMAGESLQDHPMTLPRKAGSGAAGVGSGGGGHLVPGPNGFVPRGVDEEVLQAELVGSGETNMPFRRMCGINR